MNAQEARELTRSNLKNLESLKKGIQSMASSGNFFASYSLVEILEPEKRQEELEAEGFIVTISHTTFKITW